jgi:hypothetical protein
LSTAAESRAACAFLVGTWLLSGLCESLLDAGTPSESWMAKLNSLVRNASSICLASAELSLFFSFKREWAHLAASSSLPTALSSPSI